jgi:hypothetical protein
MHNNMIVNNDLTAHQVALLSLSLNHEIDRLEKELKRSLSSGIVDNIVYFDKRLKDTNEIREIVRNTIGMKRE